MLTAGVARTRITPYWGVELTGWGYYIERRWRTIGDHLNATALVLDDGSRQAAIVALDLMVIDEQFAQRTRRRIGEAVGIPPEAVLLACSHSHNAPAAGGLLGVGECDPFYEDWSSRQAATAVVLAWHDRVAAQASCAQGELAGHTYNRTRDKGPVDTRVTTLRLDRDDGKPLALVVNFQAHPTVHTILRPFEVTRDVPGEVCDIIEATLPGVTALYLQGASGDVNFLPSYSTPERCGTPARLVADVALSCQARAEPMREPVVEAVSVKASIPTRRWQREEIEADRSEAEYRMRSGDTRGWRDGFGRVMTNRPDDMIARHGGDEVKAVRAMARFHLEWTERMLRDWETRPEHLETEVQALRVGDLRLAANSSEFFTTLALDVRRRGGNDMLMIVGYANGRIGYMPDAHDVQRKTYAAYQSPKYCNQFPFTEASGPAMCEAMVGALGRLDRRDGKAPRETGRSEARI